MRLSLVVIEKKTGRESVDQLLRVRVCVCVCGHYKIKARCAVDEAVWKDCVFLKRINIGRERETLKLICRFHLFCFGMDHLYMADMSGSQYFAVCCCLR